MWGMDEWNQDERVQATGGALPTLPHAVHVALCLSEHGSRHWGETASEEAHFMELCHVPGACQVLEVGSSLQSSNRPERR